MTIALMPEPAVSPFPKEADTHININIEFGAGDGNIPVEDVARKAEEDKCSKNMSDWIEALGGFLKLSRHEILTHADKISAKAAELKAKPGYKKYKALHLGNVSKVEKDFIKALEDMEIKLLDEEDEKHFKFRNNGEYISF